MAASLRNVNAQHESISSVVFREEMEGGRINPRGTLNPPWIEWVMGWPLGWTDFAPLETARYRLWRQQHGGF